MHPVCSTALAQGDLQVIGADTLDEYHKYVEADKALERRFHPILVEEPNIEETIRILEGIAPRYETHHQIEYDPDALQAAAQLSERYIADRCLPDKAVDLLDEAGSSKHIRLISIPRSVKDLEQEHQQLLHDKTRMFSSQNFEKAAALQMKILKIEGQLQTAREQWESDRGQEDGAVTVEVLPGWQSR